MMTLMKARLVYDGDAKPPIIPDEMGTPADNQFKGTPREQAAELCGRVCYDSLGKGRASDDYHAHIHQVGHFSVYEHTPFTMQFSMTEPELQAAMIALANRPGVWSRVNPPEDGKYQLRVTANFRAIIEWENWPVSPVLGAPGESVRLWHGLRSAAHRLAPNIVPIEGLDEPYPGDRIVGPDYPEEQWVTLFLSGSRGFSHEQVRHGDFTAISQRSTRYVNEAESPWVRHPLIEAYCADRGCTVEDFERIDMVEGPDNPPQSHPPTNAKRLYDQSVSNLYSWLTHIKKIDTRSARKQARGASRGYLGNALLTEMMFSASVRQWHLMIHQRASEFADAEIRQVYADPEDGVIAALKQSRYGDQFQCYELEDAPDGIGFVAVKK
jgi:thymidylate synthase ThyX